MISTASRPKLVIIIVGIVVGAVCLVIVWFYFLRPPGVGAQADEGYRLSETVIKALDRYHSDKGKYPDGLRDLVPDYLDNLPKSRQINRWQYQNKDTNYTLTFNYIDACNEFCTYSSDNQKWACYGTC